jgi:hypothetical protein
MVYDAADGSAGTIFDNFQAISTARSGEYVNLIGLQDTETGPTKILYIDDNNDLVELENLGEQNMGSEETLYNFVSYAKENYPADRYIMCFYGHGGAWFGCCGDATSHDGLRVHEMKGALERTGGVDLTFFTAPCLMGAVEVAYELRNCTDIFMASEGMSSFYHWTYPMERIFTQMHENPTITNIELTQMVVQEMWNDWEPVAPWGPDTLMTMSAVRSDRIDALAGAIDDLALAYLAAPDTFRARIAAMSDDVRKFEDHVADLNSLVHHLLAVEKDAGIIDKLKRIPTCNHDAVIAECHAPNLLDVGGLSIFLPESDFEWMSYYRGEEDMMLEFVSDTHWDELMELLIEQPQEPGRNSGSQLLLMRSGTVSRFLD